MKKAGALILTVIWGLLMIQPVFGSFTNGAVKPSCLKKSTADSCKKTRPARPSCSKTKTLSTGCAMKTCGKAKSNEEKKECEEQGCNPLMSCPAGNFYLNSSSHFSIASLIIPKQKTPLVNDNRISKQLTECFHPPEII